MSATMLIVTSGQAKVRPAELLENMVRTAQEVGFDVERAEMNGQPVLVPVPHTNPTPFVLTVAQRHAQPNLLYARLETLVQGAIAGAYTTPENCQKTMDGDLVKAAISKVMEVLKQS